MEEIVETTSKQGIVSWMYLLFQQNREMAMPTPEARVRTFLKYSRLVLESKVFYWEEKLYYIVSYLVKEI